MTDFHPARSGAGREALPADHGASLTLSATDPRRPDAGSALARLLGRQALPMGPGALLGFVPAQVR